MSTGYLIPVAG